MPLSPAQVKALKRKAADNSLEVEHLLKVATLGDASDAPLLRQLKVEHDWSDTGREGNDKVVPFGLWCDVVCCYLKHGYLGIVEMAHHDEDLLDFCFGLLEDVKTLESVSALLAIGGPVVEHPRTDQALSLKLAKAFNLLLSFNGAPSIDEATTSVIREFLHRLLNQDLAEAQRATCVCALRGVGDATSLELIQGLPSFSGSWVGLEASACKQIMKRLHPRK